jgi:hypothetical protein
MESRTILLSFMTLIVVGIAILVIYGLVKAGGFSGKYNPISPQKDSVTLIGPLHSGSDSLTLTTNLPRSMNENNGIEFSYAAWVLINDYTYGTTNQPVIFMRGTGTPKMSYDVNKNVLYITQKTYKGAEVIQIRNMPAEKLFHIAITVTQTAFEVYINGLIHSHVTLPSLPLIEEAPVEVGPSGGWKGLIGSLVYYNYALSAGEIRSISGTKAIPNPALTPPDPPYFATSWWLQNHQ